MKTQSFSNLLGDESYGYFRAAGNRDPQHFKGYDSLTDEVKEIVDSVCKGDQQRAALIVNNRLLLLEHYPAGEAIQDNNFKKQGYKVGWVDELSNSIISLTPKNNALQNLYRVFGWQMWLPQLAGGVLIGILALAMGWAGVQWGLSDTDNQKTFGDRLTNVVKNTLAQNLEKLEELDVKKIADPLSKKITAAVVGVIQKNLEEIDTQKTVNIVSSSVTGGVKNKLQQDLTEDQYIKDLSEPVSSKLSKSVSDEVTKAISESIPKMVTVTVVLDIQKKTNKK